jgi:membrane protein YqaA with SNARE-associated domain
MAEIIVHLIVQIVGGGLAGYAMGLKLKDYTPTKHAVYGAIGGVVLAQIMRFPITGLAGGPDFVSILGNLIASGVGGAVFTTIAGFFKEPFKY